MVHGQKVSSELLPAFSSSPDIDECSTDTHNCSQNCNNTEGSYTCGCRNGYILSSDSRTCNGRKKKNTLLTIPRVLFRDIYKL